MLRVARLAEVPWALLALTACSGAPLPGKVLGTYKVVGESKSNTCGLAAPNPWTFDVQTSESGMVFYWSWLDGHPPLSAPTTTATSVALVATQQSNVDGFDGGMGPCTMRRDDSVNIDLGGGSPPMSFSGTIRYDFSVPAGADCSDQLSGAGGAYKALPCTIEYAITASRQ